MTEGQVAYEIPQTGRTAGDSIYYSDLSALSSEIKLAGTLQKRSSSWLLALFPTWLLSCFMPLWKSRYFMVVGQFIYRFKEQYDIDKVKGCPIPIKSIHVRSLKYIEGDTARNEIDLPHCFEISMLRKTYIMQAANDRDRRTWVSTLLDAKHQIIKEDLGHVHVPPKVKKLNDKAGNLFERRLRIDAIMSSKANNAAFSNSYGTAGSAGFNPIQVSQMYGNE